MKGKCLIKLLLNSVIGILAILFVIGASVLAATPPIFPTASSVFPRAVADLGGGWLLMTYGDGSAELSVGSIAFDSVKVPPGTFPVEKRLADFQTAIDVAGPTPEYTVNPEEYSRVWKNAVLSISRDESASAPSKRSVAVFTPEVKGYCDTILATGLSDRMRALTNRNPVFSDKLMKSLTTWTNSPEYKVRSVATSAMAAVAGPAVAKPQEIPPPAPAKVQPPAHAEFPVPAPIAVKDESSGIRGWLVIGLLAIAAFLTYRFIRLRLGS